jgi:hypothetical protein
MSGPPTHIAPLALWESLNELPRPSRVVDYPRRTADGKPIGKIAIWPLTQSEMMQATGAATKVAREILDLSEKNGERAFGFEHLFNNASAVEQLYRGCRAVEDIERPAFPSPERMREKLPAEEVGALFALFMTVQIELGPIVAHMSKPEMDAWVTTLAAGGEQIPFSLLSLETQNRLVSFMACQIVDSRTATSFVGSPPSVLSEESQPRSEVP